MDPLLDEAPCGFVSLADDGRIVAANRTLAQMLALPAADLPGRHIDALLTVPARIFYQTHVFPTLKLQARLHEIYLSMRDAHGAEVPVLLNVQRKAREGRFESDWVVVPMRQRNEYENAILQARRQAEESARAKDEFLAVASHELRSPLSAITGWAHLLVQGSLDPAAQQRAARAIQQNAALQAKLVDDLLDFGRISSGKLELEVAPLRLDAVVSAAVEGVLPAANAKGIAVDATLQPEATGVSGDAGRLRQVFWNILANAVKFTPAGGRIAVRLERHGRAVQVQVSDTGKGIAPEFLPFVFERFRQEDLVARREGGLGLGMAITRYLVELHGGTIAAESAGAGEGATFTVRIPALADQSRVPPPSRTNGASQAEPPQVPDLGGMEILVVDNDAESCDWLHAVLAAAGAEVRVASSAQEALTSYFERRPGLILSDIGMEGGDGYALVRRIREIEETTGARTPAIALTGHVREADRVQTLAAGFQMHLPKPVEPVELLVAIATLRPFGNVPRLAAA